MLSLCIGILAPVAGVRAADPVSFRKSIAPILINNCLACHGPKKAEGSYRVDTFEDRKSTRLNSSH